MTRYIIARQYVLAGASVVCLGLGLMGCGSAVVAPRAYDDSATRDGPPKEVIVEKPFFVPGEQMNWKMSLRGIGGGVAVLVVGQPGRVSGKEVVIVRSRVESTGLARAIREVSDDVRTWIGGAGSFPIFYEADLVFGKKHTHLSTAFGDGSFYIDFQRRGQRPRKWRQRMPKGQRAHNAHSLLGVLRAWTPPDGTRGFTHVLSGRRLWRTDIRLDGREVTRIGMGTFPTIRYQGMARRMTSAFTFDKRKKPRWFTVWLADDATRAPLLITARTEYGEIRVELTNYQNLTSQ